MHRLVVYLLLKYLALTVTMMILVVEKWVALATAILLLADMFAIMALIHLVTVQDML